MYINYYHLLYNTNTTIYIITIALHLRQGNYSEQQLLPSPPSFASSTRFETYLRHLLTTHGQPQTGNN
jgi:hypothetical protein